MAKTWQVVLATIAIFVAGLVAGGATALGLVRWVASHPRANAGVLAELGLRQPQGPLGFSPQLMRTFAKQLDLTDEQRARIGPIVRRTASELARNRREVQLASALAIEKMQDDVSEYLTPDQRSKFDELIARQRARLQQFRQGIQQLGEQPAPPEAPK